MAAKEESLTGGELIGPDGPKSKKGYPIIETPSEGIYNEETMKKLWSVSEKLTNITFEL